MADRPRTHCSLRSADSQQLRDNVLPNLWLTTSSSHRALVARGRSRRLTGRDPSVSPQAVLFRGHRGMAPVWYGRYWPCANSFACTFRSVDSSRLTHRSTGCSRLLHLRAAVGGRARWLLVPCALAVLTAAVTLSRRLRVRVHSGARRLTRRSTGRPAWASPRSGPPVTLIRWGSWRSPFGDSFVLRPASAAMPVVPLDRSAVSPPHRVYSPVVLPPSTVPCVGLPPTFGRRVTRVTCRSVLPVSGVPS